MNARMTAVRVTILIVDDDPTVADLLEPYLDLEGYATIRMENPAHALELIAQERVDIILLDLMMPRVSGLDVLRLVRRASNVPIIIVSARVEEVERIVGLELGADDYITKPFSPREAVARIKAAMRRFEATRANRTFVQEAAKHEVDPSDVYANGTLLINRRHRTVEVEGRPIELTPKEYLILEVLAANAGHALTREQIAYVLDPHGWQGDDRTIDSHVANLRKKIEVDPTNPKLIVTVYGLGYKIVSGTRAGRGS